MHGGGHIQGKKQPWRRKEIHITLLSENLKRRNNLENQSVDARIILN
jgi:hypothetical protein